MWRHTASSISHGSLKISDQTHKNFPCLAIDMHRSCQQVGTTAVIVMWLLQGAFVNVVMNAQFKALHEVMLHAFCREAAWLMQVGVCKSGKPKIWL